MASFSQLALLNNRWVEARTAQILPRAGFSRRVRRNLVGMKRLNYEDALTAPLNTDAEIEKRVSNLIGRANIRQLWLLFLDADDVQLPLLVPIEGIPSEPLPEHTADVIDNVRLVMADVGAARLILVWERYASAALTPQDASLARALHEACDDMGVSLRAILLSHRTGVRWIAQDDYRYAGVPGSPGTRA